MLLQRRRPLRQPLLKLSKGRKVSQSQLTVRKGMLTTDADGFVSAVVRNRLLRPTTGMRPPLRYRLVTGDGTGTGAFVKQEEGPPSIKGWPGARFTRGEATEHVTVYTNIGAPKPTLFSDVTDYNDSNAPRMESWTIDRRHSC